MLQDSIPVFGHALRECLYKVLEIPSDDFSKPKYLLCNGNLHRISCQSRKVNLWGINICS